MERKTANDYRVTLTDATNFRELSPNPHRSSNIDFFIESGDHFFFEVTTQSGDDLWDDQIRAEKNLISPPVA